jgi:dTDP-3-amino-3,4,6-trideoxy-alpha-D-glucose transaminase
VGPGDEVIVPAHTYIATALAVMHAGAKPVFCDVDGETGLIDLDSAAAAVSERTVAVMPVHLYGRACDMDAVGSFASDRGLALLEDAAQAHGARWRGRRVGSFGHAAAFSFYPSKNLGAAGDGGAVCSGDPAVVETARRLRNLGQLGKGDHAIAGFNARLDTIQAAVLGVKLGCLDAWNASRRRAAGTYSDQLPAGLGALSTRPESEDVHHLFPIRTGARDLLRAELEARRVGTGIHYSPAVHRQPPFASRAASPRVALKSAERWAAEELSLPIFNGISEAEVLEVCARLEPSLAALSATTALARGAT